LHSGCDSSLLPREFSFQGSERRNPLFLFDPLLFEFVRELPENLSGLLALRARAVAPGVSFSARLWASLNLTPVIDVE
jgi:hypothetical protein